MRSPRPRAPCRRRPRSARRSERRRDKRKARRLAMGNVAGFMDFERVEEDHEPVKKRVKNYREFVHAIGEDEAKVQSARCMDCGTPFCNSGCPVNNIIPD